MDEITKHHFTNIATGKAKKNKDGSLSTVYTRQVDLPDETGKRVPTLIPSVYDGKILSEEDAVKRAVKSGKKWPTAKTHPELRKFDEKIHERMNDRTTPKEAAAELIRAADKKTINMNEGGMTLAKQMELFDEGGLKDEGGTTDPVSGNDVPPGSTQKEVRDDIPAQLSEGEFVFPADVVRYIGLETLMRMRQEAKMGLAQMEAMGQMGNSEEATMPDDLPFDEYDLEVEDDGQGELNFQAGGYVPPSIPNQINPVTGVYQTGTTGITGYQGYQGQPTGYTPYGGATPFFQPMQFTGPQYTTALQTTNLPTFAETVGTRAGQYDELVKYQNDAGQILQIPFKNGQPIYPIPEGYSKAPDEPEKAQQTTVTPTLGQVRVKKDVDNTGKEGDDDKPPSTVDVTGIPYNYSELNPTMKGLVDKYGSGFGTLKDTFNPQVYERIAAGLGITEGVPAKTNSLISASWQGVLSGYRGFKEGEDKFDVVKSSGANLNVSGFFNTEQLQDISGVNTAAIADVTKAVIEGGTFTGPNIEPVTITGMRSLFENEDGTPKTQKEVKENFLAEAAKLGVKTTGGKDGRGNWTRSLETIANDISTIKAQTAARARQAGIDAQIAKAVAESKAAAKAAGTYKEGDIISGGQEDIDRMAEARQAMQDYMSGPKSSDDFATEDSPGAKAFEGFMGTGDEG